MFESDAGAFDDAEKRVFGENGFDAGATKDELGKIP